MAWEGAGLKGPVRYKGGGRCFLRDWVPGLGNGRLKPGTGHPPPRTYAGFLYLKPERSFTVQTMQRLWKQLVRNLRRCRVRPGVPLVVAVSGGPDSTALAHLLHRWAQVTETPLTLAHYVHAWPPTGPWEAAYAEGLARDLGRPLVVGRSSQGLRARPPSEAELRRERMQFLVQTARQVGAQGIALGHHRDDQVETFLLRLLRGSGPYGLAGMRWRQAFQGTFLLRPLLNVPRGVLRRYVHTVGLHAFEDPSNEDVSRLRNWVRHRLLPWMEAVAPHVRVRLFRLTRWLDQDQRALAAVVRRRLRKCPPPWDWAEWRRLPPSLRVVWLREAYRDLRPARPLGLRHIRAVVRWLLRSGGHGRLSLPQGVVVWKDGRTWGLEAASATPPSPPDWAVPWEGEGTYTDGVGQRWVFVRKPGPSVWDPTLFRTMAEGGVLVMDAERVVPPGVIRRRRPGDRFQPLGMDRPVRLRRFLIARKVPYGQRLRLAVLETASGIAAVLGLAVAEWARVRPETQWLWEVRRGEA
jgi:tRNA(Ile)-lysidine synthase